MPDGPSPSTPREEDVGVDLIAAGANGPIAEGNEPTVAAFFGGAHDASSLIEAFEQTLDRRNAGRCLSADDRDPVTRMRGLAAPDGRLANAAHLSISPETPHHQLAQLVGRTIGLQARLGSENLTALAGSLRRVPGMPTVYAELQRLIADPDYDMRSVAAVIGRDPVWWSRSCRWSIRRSTGFAGPSRISPTPSPCSGRES